MPESDDEFVRRITALPAIDADEVDAASTIYDYREHADEDKVRIHVSHLKNLRAKAKLGEQLVKTVAQKEMAVAVYKAFRQAGAPVPTSGMAGRRMKHFLEHYDGEKTVGAITSAANELELIDNDEPIPGYWDEE